MGRQLRTMNSNEGEPAVGVVVASSARISIPNYGYTELPSTAAAEYVLDPPTPGTRKTLYAVTTTSAAVVVRGSTGTSVKIGNQGATQITFAATVAHVVELLGINSTQWIITGNFVAAETTGIVIAAT